MSISAVNSAATAQTSPLTVQKPPAKSKADGTDPTDASSSGAQGSSSASSSTSSTTVVSTATQTNADGSTTTILTYGNGTVSTSTQAAAPQSGKGAVPSLLDPSNQGQNSALLAAQENSRYANAG
jgi:hypothetical protein